MRRRRFHVPFFVAMAALAFGWGTQLGHAQAGPDTQVQAAAQPPQEGVEPQPGTVEKQQALQDRLNRITNADRKAAAARQAADRAAAAAKGAEAPDAAPAPPAEGAPQ